MSHFVVYVLSPDRIDSSVALEAYVQEQIAKYSEDVAVPEYEEDCYCKGQAARDRAHKVVEAKHGTMDEFRKKVWADPRMKPINDKQWDDRTDEDEAVADTVWAEYQKILNTTRDAYLAEDSERDAANPTCDECHGTGTRTTTYNPDSKWDWWSIGGRWSGMFQPEDKQPEKDIRNYKVCWLCQGTGKRNDDLGQRERLKNPDYGCNGCQGSPFHGMQLNHPSQFITSEDGDQIKVSDLLARPDLNKLIPFAIVTPNQEWAEKGRMGWWANVTDKNPDWKNTAKEILGKYPEHTIIAVDCHI